MMSFIFPLLYILLSNATTVLLTKKSFTKSLPLTLLLIPFPLFFSGIIFSSFKIGTLINVLYALISIVLIIKSIQENKIEEFKKNYFVYGLIVFLIVYIFIYLYDFERIFYAWDEVSHWGLMVKEMFRLDNFYTVKESTLLVHKDYPPIIQLYELFWIKCCGSFKESFVLRSLHTFSFSFLLPFLNLDNPIEKLNYENANKYIKLYVKTLIFIFSILLLISLFDIHLVMNTIYIDYPLSIMVSYAILLIMFEKEKTSNNMLIHLSTFLSFILLTKQVSLAFYMMILFFYFINIIKVKGTNKLKIIKMIILLIIIPLLTMFIWNKYVNQFDVTKQFVISDINVKELSSIISDKNNEKHIIVENYKNAIFNENISNFRLKKLTYFSSYITYTIFVFLLLFIFKEIKKKDFLKYYLTVTIGYIGYAIMMLILYLFCFKEEGYVLASFDRYMVTYLLIAFISLIMIIFRHIEIKDKLKYYILIIIILIISVNNNQYRRLVPILRKPTTHHLKLMTDYIINCTEEDSKIFIISQDVDYVEIPIYTNYYINPRKTNFEYFNLPVYCTDCEKEYNIKNILLSYDYLYIYSLTSDLYEKYPYLKDKKNKQLYKIKNVNNSIELEEVSDIFQYNCSQTPGSGS